MWHIVLAPEYIEYKSFMEDVDHFFHEKGTTIYKERNEIKTFTLENGITINVKKFKTPHLLNKVIYAIFRKPKAQRAYENAQRLTALGIATPQAMGYKIDRSLCTIEGSYLFTEHVQLTRNMYEFGDSDLDGREEIVRAFARYSAMIHQKGVYHKDYSPGNILFDRDTSGQWIFSLVDINRVKFGAVSLEDGCRNFCRLWGREAFFDILSDEYSKVIGADPKKVRDLVFHYHKRFWKNRYNHF